ncbi:MAG: integrase family protein [Rhodoferax sp.]|nr:integrase family protein [Rhodoferax sp.]
MARPSKTAPIDYAAAHDLTHGLLERAVCPNALPFVLVRDADKKGLRLRVTKAGGKAWQFETRVKGKLFTRALGGWPAVSIETARQEAHRLRGLTEQGVDPREGERRQETDKAAAVAEKAAAQIAQAQQAIAQALTVGEVWAVYIEERRPYWGDLHYRDHIDKAKAGGLPSGRRGGGKELTKPGPLAALMPLTLKDLDQATIEAWAANEGKTRASSARLAWRLLTVFLTWCAEQPTYASLMSTKNPAKTKKAHEALGKAGTKSDVLQREQLAVWFAAVQQLQNPVIAACLQMMLLTGARPGEVLSLRWEDVNTQWKGIQIRDKVEGTREIPSTPYMLHLLAALPRRNEWVFPSPTSATGCLTEPNNPHTRACTAAGLKGLTLHGLRRSFASLTEWLEVPAGVVAQIQGHKPSATAEKHYKVRPLELLRVHHERIEGWILEQAGIVFDAGVEPGRLRVVNG